MNNFVDLRSAYDAAKAELTAAQSAERDARRNQHNASTALSSALHAHVAARFIKDEVLKVSDRVQFSNGEVMIVDIRVEVFDPTTVKAVYLVRTKAGAWGKTRTTSANLVWDFEQEAWGV